MTEQLAAVLAGDLPDAFMCGANMTDSLITQNTNLWHVITMEELEAYCPTYLNVCETYIDGWKDFTTYPDGNMYGLMGSVYDSERHYASGVLFMNYK